MGHKEYHLVVNATQLATLPTCKEASENDINRRLRHRTVDMKASLYISNAFSLFFAFLPPRGVGFVVMNLHTLGSGDHVSISTRTVRRHWKLLDGALFEWKTFILCPEDIILFKEH